MNSSHHHFQELQPRIIVMGVGGAGGNAVNNMIASGLQGVEFVAANTDAQALSMSGADVRFQLGANLTEGLGAGSNPEIGEGAAEEVLDEMRQLLEGAHMIFVACGMGGGTGTGAAPVVARIAQEMGVLTVGVVTKPFHFEGRRRMRIAEAGIEQLRQHVDTMIVIPNQNLFRLANEQTTFADSFQLADQVLNSGVACVTDLIMKEGLINLDFADVKTVITEMGAAVMGTGMAEGENRADRAAEEAISNPLIDDISLAGAKGLLISISGGHDMTLFEVDEVASRIRSEVDPDANIIVGATFDDHLQGYLRVSLVASGLNHAHPKSMHEEADRVRMEQDSKLEQEGLASQNSGQNPGLNDRLKELETGPDGRFVQPGGRLVAQDGASGHGHRVQGQGGHGQPGDGQLRDGQEKKGQVQIKNKPPRFMSDGMNASIGDQGRLEPHAHGRGGDVAMGDEFVPGAPQTVHRSLRRMPNIDEFPVTGQAEMRAYEAAPTAHGVVAQKKKVGFFDRITGRNRAQTNNEQPEVKSVRGAEPEIEQRPEQVGEPVFRDAHGNRPPAPTPVPASAIVGDAALGGQGGVIGQGGVVGQGSVPYGEPMKPASPYHNPPVNPSIQPLPPQDSVRDGEVAQPQGGGRPDERYPTLEIHKVPPVNLGMDDDDEPITDIPPFLRKTQNKG